MNTELDRWFVAEVLPLEGALTRYLRGVFRNAADVADIRQDIYVRLYESAGRSRPRLVRAFLFATARNLVADRIRRRKVVSIGYTQDLEGSDVLIDQIAPDECLSARQDLQRLTDAFDTLSDRCRRVIWLRRVEGISQREAARRLGMREGTLESCLCRGVRALAIAVFGGESDARAHGSVRRRPDREMLHGQRGD